MLGVIVKYMETDILFYSKLMFTIHSDDNYQLKNLNILE